MSQKLSANKNFGNHLTPDSSNLAVVSAIACVNKAIRIKASDSATTDISFSSTFQLRSYQTTKASKMSKFFVAVFFCLAAVSAFPQAPPAGGNGVSVVSSSSNVDQNGFAYNFETSDGTKQEATGTLKDITNDDGSNGKAIVQTGSYTYVSPEGQTITINYTADENGYQPQGDSIPVVAPPA